MTTLGLIGARGHVGAELIRLLDAHGGFELALAMSRSVVGKRVCEVVDGVGSGLMFEDLAPQAIAERRLDALVLAMPNGEAARYVEAVERVHPETVIIDLSADYRFDPHWYYGLPELTRQHAEGRARISNPGCYATAMQLAIAPFVDLLAGPVQCFGVSGFSGAGTTPSDRNDPEKLRDNLMPYSSIGHVHEREVSRQLGHAVEFMPTVVGFFRGITMTVNLHFREAQNQAGLQARLQQRYQHESLVQLQSDAPWVSRFAGRPTVGIGGLAVSADGHRAVLVSVLDNLLKGAASQCLQNLNLAFGKPELQGIVQ